MRTLALVLTLTILACSETPPAGPAADPELQAWGPETPNFNLEVVLEGAGFGLVRFRQPNDAEFVVHLDTWVKGLAPNTAYRLQRAVDPVINDVCTSTDWLTLGQGLTPYAIVTDDRGTATAELWRGVPALPGSEFDIHFRVIDNATGAVVLQSRCYQYRISL